MKGSVGEVASTTAPDVNASPNSGHRREPNVANAIASDTEVAKSEAIVGADPRVGHRARARLCDAYNWVRDGRARHGVRRGPRNRRVAGGNCTRRPPQIRT
jgi:hypothetical protein